MTSTRPSSTNRNAPYATAKSARAESGPNCSIPELLDTTLAEDELSSAIDTRMPEGSPDECRGECATALAGYIRAHLTEAALTCDELAPSPRRLRLLTRRDYRNTVSDLFGDVRPPPMPCTSALQCEFRDSCTADMCVHNECDAHTFVFDSQGQSYGSVHVAGSFNGWPGTIGGGGWPLSYDSGTGLWTLQRDVGAGSHQYKFVLDENTWVADERNLDSVDDGFGGQNSVLALICPGGAGGGVAFDFDPTAAFPVESRPEGFFYDNNADAAQVTAVHMDGFLFAARDIASDIDVAPLSPCALSAGHDSCALQSATLASAYSGAR